MKKRSVTNFSSFTQSRWSEIVARQQDQQRRRKMAGCTGAQAWHSPLHRVPQGNAQRLCIPSQIPGNILSCQGLHRRNSHSAKHGLPWGRNFGHGLSGKSTSTAQLFAESVLEVMYSITVFCCVSGYLLLGAPVVHDICNTDVFRQPVLQSVACLQVER